MFSILHSANFWPTLQHRDLHLILQLVFCYSIANGENIPSQSVRKPFLLLSIIVSQSPLMIAPLTHAFASSPHHHHYQPAQRETTPDHSLEPPPHVMQEKTRKLKAGRITVIGIMGPVRRDEQREMTSRSNSLPWKSCRRTHRSKETETKAIDVVPCHPELRRTRERYRRTSAAMDIGAPRRSQPARSLQLPQCVTNMPRKPTASLVSHPGES